MKFFLPVAFILLATTVGVAVQQCNGTNPEMHPFYYLKPTNFIIGSGNVTVESRDACAKICTENSECAFAYYFMYKCYQANYFTTTLKRWQPGQTLVKLFRDESSCNTSFPKLMSNSVQFKVASRQGATYSFTLSDDTVSFTYNAAGDRFGKRK